MSQNVVTIKNADIVLPGGLFRGDLRAEGGTIAAVGRGLPADGEVVDASGLVLMPGVIDPQVHFREPGATHKEDLATGSRAAAAGGVTTFLDMPNNVPSVTTRALMAEKKAAAAKKSVVNYGFFIGATPDNLEELNAVENVCGIKVFMGSSTGTLLVNRPEDLERIFANGRRLIAVHAEDEGIMADNAALLSKFQDVATHPRIRDEACALKASSLAVRLSLRHGRRLHILHMTTAEEAEMVRALPRSAPITCEVCPQHFTLAAPEAYERLGTRAQMNPPIRSARHGAALWAALKDGVVDCLATDHAPHTLEEKSKPYGQAPSGMPGVETLLPLMLERRSRGDCDWNDLARWMCEGPARVYGMRGKGRIAPGMDADLVLVDPDEAWTVTDGSLFTKVNWSPYHGMTLRGRPKRTFVGGRTVFNDGAIVEGALGSEVRFAD